MQTGLHYNMHGPAGRGPSASCWSAGHKTGRSSRRITRFNLTNVIITFGWSMKSYCDTIAYCDTIEASECRQL